MERGFDFGEWLILDGKTECQFIENGKGTTKTIDILGHWINVDESRLEKDIRYS